MPGYTGGLTCKVSSGNSPSNTTSDHGHDSGGRADAQAKIIKHLPNGRVIVQFPDGEQRDYHRSELEK